VDRLDAAQIDGDDGGGQSGDKAEADAAFLDRQGCAEVGGICGGAEALESYERLIAMVEEARRVQPKREVEAELGATPAVRILMAAKAPPTEQGPQTDKTEQDQGTPRDERGGRE
jgi:hypothetical protein